jgi:hypothetical protein
MFTGTVADGAISGRHRNGASPAASTSRGRRFAWLATAQLVLAGLGWCPAVTAVPVDEVDLKTEFVYHVIAFSRWPTGSMPGPGQPLRLCIAGEDRQAEALRTLDGARVNGHPVRVTGPDDAAGTACHLVYFGASEGTDYGIRLARLCGLPLLTLSSIRGFSDNGGILQFYRAESGIRFRVNLAALRRSGMALDPGLLDLAETVDTAGSSACDR